MDDGLTPARSAEPNSLATAPSPEAAASHRRQRGVALSIPGAWPLAPVLVVQAILSIRLVRADTAFLDEATYLWAGHLEWAHWLHNAPIPPFPSYFSGAPVIYPPLAAVADSVGGLTAARMLSLIFMLGATVLLWSAARQLFGRQVAFFGAALFAILGPTLHLGAFATYDAMSVFLIGLAAWLVIRAGARPEATRLLILAGVVLALANAAAYSSALFDVIVILVAFLMAAPQLGARTAATRCLTVFIVVAVLLGAGLLIGGSTYWQGVRATTLQRTPGGASPLTVLGDAWLWTGVIVAAALCGVVISWVRREGRWSVLFLAVLTVAALIGPLEQANLHTAASLDKHVGLGAWFAAIAAGYAVDKLIAAVPVGQTRTITCGACVVALALPLSLGATQSHTFSTNWPNSASFIAILRPLVEHGSGRLLVEDPEIAEYYLHAESQWERWSSTRNIVLPSGASSGGPSSAAGVLGQGNVGTYGTKIIHDYFSLVALNFADTTPLDHKIRADLGANHRYRIIQVVPYGAPPGTYVIWQLGPSS
jgi:hypothetical protein